jgi:hypothetical protein
LVKLLPHRKERKGLRKVRKDSEILTLDSHFKWFLVFGLWFLAFGQVTFTI